MGSVPLALGHRCRSAGSWRGEAGPGGAASNFVGAAGLDGPPEAARHAAEAHRLHHPRGRSRVAG
eukprot:6982752-Lingulodinium_polyedra.AAC.1